MKSSRAFTLIELLVVIAIIAILAAILFPVFAQAKMAAKKTQSLSNAKNQITAVMMYSNDFDDTYTFSEAGCDNNGTQVQWYATIYPYVKNGKTETNATTGITQAWGNDGIYRDPAHPDANQGQQYGLNRDIFPSNFCPGNIADITPSVNGSAIDAPADKVAIGIKNKNGAYWSYPYFSADEWMWTAKWKKDGSGNVVSDGGEIMSGLAPRDWGYVMNKDCNTDSFEECGAGMSWRYNGQTVVSYLDGHAKTQAKGRLLWWKNIAFNNGHGWWGPANPWYPYNGF